jgi:hypothetical protein
MVCVQTWGNKCEMPSCVLEDKASDDHRMVECAEVCVLVNACMQGVCARRGLLILCPRVSRRGAQGQ